MLLQPTLSQRRSVTLSANNLVIHNVVATFLGVYRFSLPQRISERCCNDIPTLSQRSNNVELLAGMGPNSNKFTPFIHYCMYMTELVVNISVLISTCT